MVLIKGLSHGGARMTAYLRASKLAMALLLASSAVPLAQGVPVIDGSTLAEAIKQLAEGAKDAKRQDKKIAQNKEKNDLYQRQIEAYERFLENTTGTTDLSGFEAGDPGFASAEDTFPVVETHGDADRLFGANQTVEKMIIVTAKKYQTHAGVAAAGLTPLTWRILFQSLIKQESRFNNAAVSHVGARGLCQLMPGTASDLGVDPRDPWQNLDGGARYILAQLKRFGRIDYALAAYNAGPGRVLEYGGVPPFEETQTYIRKINKYYAEYVSIITGIDYVGSLEGVDGASAAWGNWGDASMGYTGYQSAQIDQAMGRIKALLERAAPKTAKEAVDHNTYMLAERARLMALTLRLRAAQAKVEAARGMTEAADQLENSQFWRYNG